MTKLREILDRHVSEGIVPGAVALVDRGGEVEVEAVGDAIIGSTPMARDTVFRLASVTKPITAAAAMLLVDDGRIALDDPIADWLPELASPVVVRTPQSLVDDVVPAARPVTVFDLLTFRAGWGFPSDFSLPAAAKIFALGHPLKPQSIPAPDEWLARLAEAPMLYQPGEAWLYNTCSDILGVLIARAVGMSLPEFLAERIFTPLGMKDTGFAVTAENADRLGDFYQAVGTGFGVADAPDGEWSTPPAFPAGCGGLVSTVDDWHAFARMLLAGGGKLLSAESVRQMTTDHLTPDQRESSRLFLEGQGWGFGGSVDVDASEPWTVPGRYGWVGGTGTAAHVDPASGTIAIMFTQVGMRSPMPPMYMRDFWRYAA